MTSQTVWELEPQEEMTEWLAGEPNGSKLASFQTSDDFRFDLAFYLVRSSELVQNTIEHWKYVQDESKKEDPTIKSLIEGMPYGDAFHTEYEAQQAIRHRRQMEAESKNPLWPIHLQDVSADTFYEVSTWCDRVYLTGFEIPSAFPFAFEEEVLEDWKKSFVDNLDHEMLLNVARAVNVLDLKDLKHRVCARIKLLLDEGTLKVQAPTEVRIMVGKKGQKIDLVGDGGYKIVPKNITIFGNCKPVKQFFEDLQDHPELLNADSFPGEKIKLPLSKMDLKIVDTWCQVYDPLTIKLDRKPGEKEIQQRMLEFSKDFKFSFKQGKQLVDWFLATEVIGNQAMIDFARNSVLVMLDELKSEGELSERCIELLVKQQKIKLRGLSPLEEPIVQQPRTFGGVVLSDDVEDWKFGDEPEPFEVPIKWFERSQIVQEAILEQIVRVKADPIYDNSSDPWTAYHNLQSAITVPVKNWAMLHKVIEWAEYDCGVGKTQSQASDWKMKFILKGMADQSEDNWKELIKAAGYLGVEDLRELALDYVSSGVGSFGGNNAKRELYRQMRANRIDLVEKKKKEWKPIPMFVPI